MSKPLSLIRAFKAAMSEPGNRQGNPNFVKGKPRNMSQVTRTAEEKKIAHDITYVKCRYNRGDKIGELAMRRALEKMGWKEVSEGFWEKK